MKALFKFPHDFRSLLTGVMDNFIVGFNVWKFKQGFHMEVETCNKVPEAIL